MWKILILFSSWLWALRHRYCQPLHPYFRLFRYVFSCSPLRLLLLHCPFHLHNRRKTLPLQHACFILPVSLYKQCWGGRWQRRSAPQWGSQDGLYKRWLLHYVVLITNWRTTRKEHWKQQDYLTTWVGMNGSSISNLILSWINTCFSWTPRRSLVSAERL